MIQAKIAKSIDIQNLFLKRYSNPLLFFPILFVVKIVHYSKTFFLIVARLLSILFKRKRQIQKKRLNYYNGWYFDNAYLIIDFEFENALWFQIGNTSFFDNSKYIVLDLSKFKDTRLVFSVIGFFYRKEYEIHIKKETKLNAENFQTSINSIEIKGIMLSSVRANVIKFFASISKPKFEFKSFSFNKKEIQFNFKPFNTQDYL